MKYIGIFYLVIGLYGCFASYRVLVHYELFWYYPNLYYRKKDGYSKTLCNVIGYLSFPVILLFLFLGFKILSGG